MSESEGYLRAHTGLLVWRFSTRDFATADVIEWAVISVIYNAKRKNGLSRQETKSVAPNTEVRQSTLWPGASRSPCIIQLVYYILQFADKVGTFP
jgi:hypothetical protein